MLAVAESTGLYKEVHQVVLGRNEFPKVLRGRFRAVVSVGTLGRLHAPPEALDEMVASLVGEAGDALVFTIREDCYRECGF